MKDSAHETVKVVHLLDPASYSAGAEAFSSAADCQGYGEALIVVQCGAFTATGDVSFQVEGSADNSTWADITDATIAEKVQADDQKVYVGRIDLSKQPRYIRVGYDVDDDAAIFGIMAVLLDKKYKPASQENTLAFNV